MCICHIYIGKGKERKKVRAKRKECRRADVRVIRRVQGKKRLRFYRKHPELILSSNWAN